MSLTTLPVERTLGIQWNVESDTLGFRITLKDQPLTRRGMLSTIASIYDPLGLISPITLVGKRILQDMCKQGVGWDDPLPDDLRPRWEKWRSELPALQDLRVPRCYHPSEFGNIICTELHHFSDASTSGYGQCSYVRLVDSTGKIQCALVMAKSRVSPSKVMTIPRLELSAAVLSVKISRMLRAELEYDSLEENFWTDSQVVLGYIRNDAKRFHVFVANRVQEIQHGSDPEQWHYIRTDQNTADHASRGITVKELMQSRWFCGPEMLWERSIKPEAAPAIDLHSSDPEVRSHVNATHQQQSSIISRLDKFSTWKAAIRAIARLQRVASKEKVPNVTTVSDRQKAELFIVKQLQCVTYAKELDLLQRCNGRLPRSNSLYPVNAIVLDGILRVGGRLHRASMPADVKHPAILPRDSHITKLIIADCHERVAHQGKNTTLNEIRSSGFWIVGASKAVSSYIHGCVKCRRLRRPVEEQLMADLPQDRTDPAPPFTHSGMDCFGPFLTKQGRRTSKRYGLLFTCLASRAVHIEMLDDMSTDSFINGLRCFLAIRGTVQHIRSDQGTNFVGARTEFQQGLKELDFDRLQAYLADRQCEFLMNAPSASHAGGVWERQIRTVKTILSSIMQPYEGRLDDSSLRTLLYEAMNIVNNRPLSRDMLTDPEGLTPLTPNHLLTLKSSTAMPPPGVFIKEDMYLKKRWRRVQYLVEQFWSRWRREYLTSISQRQKWHEVRRNVKVGDVVIIKEADAPRNTWNLARVIEALQSDDGLVRKVKLQMSNPALDNCGRRTNKLSVIERPVQKLVVILED